MESLAQPGAILVSKNTYQKVNPYFDFEDLGKYEVKGKKEQQEVYKLNRQRERSHLGFTRQIYPEMVGRDAELNKLELQVLKAVDGDGSIVNVIGEAGIGKSRLIAELKNREIIKKVALREGRAISMGKGLSFYPVVDIYKNWAKIKEGDSDATAINKLETSIRSVTPQDLNEILPFIATLMGIKLKGRYAERVKGIEGEALEKLILKNVKDLLIKSSGLIPIVIVIEDLHWADLSTIELLESLFRLAETQRILFINVFRPRYTETGVRIVQTIKENFPNHYVEIELQPLNEQMSETLINNILNIGGLPHGVRDRIVIRSGGNPFFIEEVVRSFIDDGIILRKNGEFEVTPKIESVVIPQTINDVLIARIDRLEDKTKDLVKTASVIGRSFFHRILTEVLKTFEDIDNRLEYLKEIQLIRDRIRLEELEYLFKHALTQEAAYESLLVQKRKELHHLVAQSIEIVFSDKIYEFYGMLAFHYSKGEDLEKAEEYMIKAGEEALRSSASLEALTYYKEALKLYIGQTKDKADPEKLAKYEKNIATAYFNKGQYENALTYFDSVLAHWRIRYPKRSASVLFILFYHLISLIVILYFPSIRPKKIPNQRVNDFFNLVWEKDITLVHVNPKRSFTEQIGELVGLFRYDISKVDIGTEFLLGSGTLFCWTGFFKPGKKLLAHAEHFVKPGNNTHQIAYHFFSTVCNYTSGSWSDIKSYDDTLTEFGLTQGEFWYSACYIFFHTENAIERGNFGHAERLIKKLSEIWEKYDYEMANVFHHNLKARLSIKIRNIYDAQISADELLLLSIKKGVDPHQLTSHGFRATTDLLLKDMESAKEFLSQAQKIEMKQDFWPPLFISPMVRASLFLEIRLIEDALCFQDKSRIVKHKKSALQKVKMAFRHTMKYAPDRPGIFRLIGVYWWIIGKQNRAVKWWKKATEEGERLMARPDLARTYMEIGKRLSEKTSKHKEINGISAEQYLEKAREMFEEMNLQWDLDELDRIVSYR
jgi:tetratricopeptide (TPR) repeat protein/type II secretory pathway predicted ATPase ExeA